MDHLEPPKSSKEIVWRCTWTLCEALMRATQAEAVARDWEPSLNGHRLHFDCPWCGCRTVVEAADVARGTTEPT